VTLPTCVCRHFARRNRLTSPGTRRSAASLVLRLARVGLIVGALFLALAVNSPSSTTPYTQGVALSATAVIGLQDQGCGGAGSAVVLSNDRGQTWTDTGRCVCRGGYVATIEPESSDAVVTCPDNSVLWLRRDGVVDARTSGAPMFHSVAATGSVIFGTAANGTARPGLIWRADQSGAHLCGTISGYANSIAAQGQIVVASTPSGKSFESTDGCATFKQFVTPGFAHCVVSGRVGLTTIVLNCVGPTKEEVFGTADGQHWTRLPNIFAGDVGFSAGVAIPLDDWGRQDSPSSYPATAPGPQPVAAPAPPAARLAIQFVNTRYRRPLGLPDISWDGMLARAATAHARYLMRNPPPPGLAAHLEQRGRPGFTGVTSTDRCKAAGSSGSGCSEVVDGTANLLAAVTAWLDTPYHGPAMFFPRVGLGSSRGWAVGEVGVSTGFGSREMSFLTKPNSATAALRVWPGDGATNVPTSWNGGEWPDPLRFYRRDKSDIGPVIYVGSAAIGTVKVVGPSGVALPILTPPSVFSTRDTGPGRTASTRIQLSGDGSEVPVPYMIARRLQPNQTYTIVVSLVSAPGIYGGATYRFRFHTS
jgi:hypothetical protein